MALHLFIIDYEVTNEDFDIHNTCVGIYNDLETAKNELKNIYNNTKDYKFFCYKIKVYQLTENEYKFTNQFYTYKFDEFTEYKYVT